MSALAFLSLSPAAVDEAVVARSPMERLAKHAGARFEVRDGWNVAVDYDRPPPDTVAWADVSHLSKWEVPGIPGPAELGTATRDGPRWICPLTADRALVLGGREPPPGGLDVTCNYAALTVLGPQARETIARFCALDLRPQVSPPNSVRPGSIARQPGLILVQGEDRYLLLFGWAVAEYMWTVVEDAAKPRGGRPIGIEALDRA